MIACLSEIMNKELITIDAYEGLCKADRIMDERRLDSLPVIKEGKLIGILTSRDMRKAHPNRIVADAITKNIITAKPETSLWEAKALIEKHLLNELVVVENEKLLGVVTDTRLYEELGKHIDLLTGLYRRDYVYYHGVELFDKGVEISMIFIDMDKFGRIDKDYGHMLGDSILKEIGNILKSNMPSDLYMCRFGGDEFIVLTPYKLEKCKILAENLIKAISSHGFSNGITITASMGIAGGRRNDARMTNSRQMISDIINLASLASTKAKKCIDKLAIDEGDYSTEIA